jgi:hypothetical protein
MIITTPYNGRLGNQIIRNLAVSLIAEKHNIYVQYSSHDITQILGIRLFVGTRILSEYPTIQLSDDNFCNVLAQDQITFNLEPNVNYFQTKEITNILHTYLQSEPIKSNIINLNPFRERYGANNDVAIHIRLTDVATYNPGERYYIETLNRLSYANAYIFTDEPVNSIVENIITNCPNVAVINFNEVATIQFASTCKHIILSHGSFSAIIGYLAFQSDVYYPRYESDKIWYGDMFSIDGWHCVNN